MPGDFLDKLKDEKASFIGFDRDKFVEAIGNLENMSLIEKVRYISPY